MRVCTLCEKPKPLTDFYRNKKSEDGYLRRCKECMSDIAFLQYNGVTKLEADNHHCEICGKKMVYRKNRDIRMCYECRKTAYGQRFKKFGLTPYEYAVMRDNQDGLCAGCRKSAPYYHVDHDHSTGVVRGLLCQPCNMALGLLKDSKVTLSRLINYLPNHPKEGLIVLTS